MYHLIYRRHRFLENRNTKRFVILTDWWREFHFESKNHFKVFDIDEVMIGRDLNSLELVFIVASDPLRKVDEFGYTIELHFLSF